MTILIDQLSTAHEFSACEALQRATSDQSVFFAAPALVAIEKCNGLILAAMRRDGEMCGTIIDIASVDTDLSSWFTAFHAVSEDERNKGIGTMLRSREREIGMQKGVALVKWAIDPLRSLEAHVAFNKLGAVAVGYERDLYGELRDSRNEGLATDRLLVEWWLTAPRVNAVIDRHALPHHFHLGLDKMEVATRTRLTDGGLRRLLGFDDSVCAGVTRGAVVLVEIPAKLDRIRANDLDLARDWRLQTRDIFERMFAAGYTITGLVHEGGRSFQLFERVSKATILERDS